MEEHNTPKLIHKQKKWNEYFIEFILVFLAITMGFFAENIRENIIDREKENEFILSMIEDAETDIKNIHVALDLNKKRILNLDTLAYRCNNFGNPGIGEKELYRSFFPALRHPDFVSPTERTLMQLKNAGGMSLIRKKPAIDRIIQYDDFSKKLIDQQTWYEDALTSLLEPSTRIFNQKYYPSLKSELPWLPYSHDSLKLITTEKLKLIEFGNHVLLYRSIVMFYIIRLEEGEQNAVELINTLRKEYNVE
jgi:hypothetical protein